MCVANPDYRCSSLTASNEASQMTYRVLFAWQLLRVDNETNNTENTEQINDDDEIFTVPETRPTVTFTPTLIINCMSKHMLFRTSVWLVF